MHKEIARENVDLLLFLSPFRARARVANFVACMAAFHIFTQTELQEKDNVFDRVKSVKDKTRYQDLTHRHTHKHMFFLYTNHTYKILPGILLLFPLSSHISPIHRADSLSLWFVAETRRRWRSF